jgi:hypothetical protein
MVLDFLVILFLLFPFNGFAVNIQPVSKSGRMVQLDGFLLEWNKDSAKALAGGYPWAWDAMATKEGFTGYVKTTKALTCHDWTFTFLARRLSPYASMKMSTSPDQPQTFYRLNLPNAGPDSSLAVEWVIPWDSVTVDTSGAYQIGLMAVDSCGDTLTPVIFNGHAYTAEKTSPWGKVYSKGIFLAVLLAALYYLRRSTGKKFKLKRKR